VQFDTNKTLGLAKPSEASPVDGAVPLSAYSCISLQASLTYANQPKVFLITKLCTEMHVTLMTRYLGGGNIRRYLVQ
jgi:hypothetical protein